MNEKEIAAMDQTLTAFKDIVPEELWLIYQAFCKAGFTEDQAMQLTIPCLRKMWLKGGAK